MYCLLVIDLQNLCLLGLAEGSGSDARSRQSGGRGQPGASMWRHQIDNRIHKGNRLGPEAGVRGAFGRFAADHAGLADARVRHMPKPFSVRLSATSIRSALVQYNPKPCHVALP